MSKRSKNSTSSSETSKRSEPEWVVADAGESSGESHVEREHIDEPDIDVYQPGPDEPTWTRVEPVAASEAEGAPRVAKKTPRATGAKSARVGGKARKPATSDVAAEAAPSNDADAPSAPERRPKRAAKRSATHSDEDGSSSTKGDTGERKETLVDERATEVATAVTETNASPPLTKKRELQDFVAERAEQRARERDDERAADRAAERASDVTVDNAEQRTAEPVDHQWDAIPSAPQPEGLVPMEQFLAELSTLSVAQLVRRHVEVVGKAPRIKSRPWLVRKLGWIEQTKRYGGLSVAAKRKLEELMGEIELPVPTPRATKPDAPATRSADDLPLGVRLERKWRDRVIVATRVEGGWSCEGTNYRTLSAAAKAISGTHCSGPAFFGIWKPKGGTR